MKNNPEMKKIISRVKTAQSQLEKVLKDKTWVEEARKYAEKQGKEVRKLFESDVTKVRVFLEKERKELEKFQKQIPGEVAKLRKFVVGQRKELEKLLTRVGKIRTTKPASRSKKRASSGTRKRKTASQSASSPSA